MKILSYNICGIKSSIAKGLIEYLGKQDADIICLQEIKSDLYFVVDGYYQYWNLAEKKGYSGVMILSKIKPKSCKRFRNDDEGRLLMAEYENFWIITSYSPNSQKGLARIDYRIRFETRLCTWIKNQTKPCILAGDLNVCHKVCDCENFRKTNPSCSDQERNCLQDILDLGYVDSFRSLYPKRIDYTFFDFITRSRGVKNNGYRLDYFVCEKSLMKLVKDVIIDHEINISDHEPILLKIDLQ